jgi:flavorubredoxin
MRQLRPNIYAVGAIDWDRRMFDELIPLPDGTSYNAYIVKGTQKTALLDTVDPAKTGMLFEHLDELGIKQIDYIVAHHAEQDHSGSIPDVLKRWPQAKVLTNAKCKDYLIELLRLGENQFETVADGQEISLGGKTLEFLITPWVHWPETMVTYLREDKILFSCDFFGSHFAPSTLYVEEEAIAHEAAKRYFAEIMMPFRASIRKNIEKIGELPIDIIAPSHGFVYDKPAFILNAYNDWSSDNVKNEVLVPYTSMHGSVRKMVDHFIDALSARGITPIQFNLAEGDLGKLATALVDAATIVLGCSQVLAGAHPNVAHAAFVANALRPKTKFVSIIGSMLWGGKMVEQLTGLIPNLKAEIIEPVVIKGFPREEDLKAIDTLADKILTKHKQIGIA